MDGVVRLLLHIRINTELEAWKWEPAGAVL